VEQFALLAHPVDFGQGAENRYVVSGAVGDAGGGGARGDRVGRGIRRLERHGGLTLCKLWWGLIGSSFVSRLPVHVLTDL